MLKVPAGPPGSVLQPNGPVRAIAHLPVGRKLALRVYNRLLMHLSPRHQVRTWFGSVIDCDARDMIQATIIHFRSWEPNTSRIFSRIVRDGDTVVDVGANIGYYSLLFSTLVGPGGKVVAIEASPKIAATLAQNIATNDARNVRIANVAVAAERGTATIYEAPSTNIGMTTTRPDRGFPVGGTVEALPLTDILTAEEATRTRLIKIDIEGAEAPVVAAILDNLDAFAPDVAIAVEGDAGTNPEWLGLFARFREHGYHAYDLGNDYDWIELMAGHLRELQELEMMPDGQVDILFTRTEM
jgi:FkbM family methyltransferase